MSEEDQEEGGEVCVRCAHPNSPGTSRCEHCGVPLDPSASTHPWEMKSANHHAYSAAASPGTKPIIFWGVWLYFGPSFLGAVWMLWTLIDDSLNNPFFEMDLDTVVLLVLPLGYGILSAWALWSVTKAYFGKSGQNR